MPGPVFLQAESVTLRPAEKEGISFLRTNEQDPAVRASRSRHAPVDMEGVQRQLGGTMGRDDETLGLLICVSGTPVGFTYLLREQPTSLVFRAGELAYWVTPAEQGNGYATTAGELLLTHAFDTLGLHRVEASAFGTNEASQRVLAKLGFSEEGIERDGAFVDGEWMDVVRYSLLADEWRPAGQES